MQRTSDPELLPELSLSPTESVFGTVSQESGESVLEVATLAVIEKDVQSSFRWATVCFELSSSCTQACLHGLLTCHDSCPSDPLPDSSITSSPFRITMPARTS